MLRPPGANEYAPFFGGYVALVGQADAMAVLAEQPEELRRLSRSIPPDLETFRYAPDKWSVREVAGHLGDAERAFGFRAHCISRGETAALPGFDEQRYVAESVFASQTVADLVEELNALRAANLAMLRRLNDAAWDRTGTANGTSVSVRALAYIMAGHVIHHCRIIRSRYGVGDEPAERSRSK